MNNNDIFRRLRYIFDLKDQQVVDLFNQVETRVDKAQVVTWLKKDTDEGFQPLHDIKLSAFLNGFIVSKRGVRDGNLPKAEKKLNNNLILRKLKIALSLKDTDMIEIFDLAKFRVSKHEINAFFRSPGQKQFRECKDQFLRNFLLGLQIKYQGPISNKNTPNVPW